jgi:hypothetical protein
MEFLADVGTFFPIVSSEFQPGSGERPKVFVVSLDWTRPKRNDCQASHALYSCWAFLTVSC